MAQSIYDLLNQLTKRLEDTFEDRLLSVVLYGSAATGEFNKRFSDINILCVLSQITPVELRQAEPVIRWWRSLDNPSPLFLTHEEMQNSTDCFPIEFHDIVASHTILHGEDLVAGLQIGDSFYRGQLEHELRAKLIRLRQKAGGMLSDRRNLLRLMAESVSTFANLSRHCLLVANPSDAPAAPLDKRQSLAACATRFGIDPAPFYTLLDLREGAKAAKSLDPPALLADYMEQIQALIAAVDRTER